MIFNNIPFDSVINLFRLNKKSRINNNLVGFGNIELLAETLRRAVSTVPRYKGYNTPALGASDDEVRECLGQFPITFKKDLNNDLDNFISSDFKLDSLKTASSSGSTGVPLTILRDRSEYTVEQYFVHTAWKSLGIGEEDRVAVLRTGYDKRQGNGIGFIDNKGVFWVQLTDLSDENLYKVLLELKSFSPALIRGNGSLVAAVLQFSHESGIKLSSLKGAAYSSDEMFPEQRSFIREIMGIGLVSLWGQTERAALAVTKPHSNEFNCVEDYGYIELVRPDGTSITELGEYGMIVGTSLFPRATAMIRYATGDYAAWASPGVLTNIIGRGTAIMTTVTGEKMHIPIAFREDVLNAVPADVNVQFFQPEPGCLVLRVDKPKRDDMDLLIHEFQKMADHFTLRIDWSSKLDVLPSGKRQLYCNASRSS